MADEKRRYVRKRVDLQAMMKLPDGQAVEAHITDMCPGGAFIELAENPAFGTKIHLDIVLPKNTVRADATVRWAKGTGVGVQFGLLGVKETYAITEHLADLEPAPDSRRM